MELRQLRYFCKVCELGTMTAAASALFVSEQTISASIANFEIELGAKLLDRGRHGAKPTTAGDIAYRRSSAILRQAEELANAVRPQVQQGMVRFAYVADSMLAQGQAPSFDALEEFKRTHANIAVHAFECSNASCLKNVMEGAADIALVVGNPDERSFASELVMHGSQELLIPAGHALASKQSVSFADLRSEKLLVPPEIDFTLPLIVQRCRVYGFEPDFIPVPQRFYFEYVAQGKGLAFAPEGHPMARQCNDIVAKRLATQDELSVPLRFVTKHTAKVSPATLAFKNFVLQRWQNPG